MNIEKTVADCIPTGNDLQTCWSNFLTFRKKIQLQNLFFQSRLLVYFWPCRFQAAVPVLKSFISSYVHEIFLINNGDWNLLKTIDCLPMQKKIATSFFYHFVKVVFLFSTCFRMRMFVDKVIWKSFLTNLIQLGSDRRRIKKDSRTKVFLKLVFIFVFTRVCAFFGQLTQKLFNKSQKHNQLLVIMINNHWL